MLQVELRCRLKAQAPLPGIAALTEPPSLKASASLTGVGPEPPVRTGPGCGQQVSAPAALRLAPGVAATGLAAPRRRWQAVVAQPPIGRARYTGLRPIVRQLPQEGQCVCVFDSPAHPDSSCEVSVGLRSGFGDADSSRCRATNGESRRATRAGRHSPSVAPTREASASPKPDRSPTETSQE